MRSSAHARCVFEIRQTRQPQAREPLTLKGSFIASHFESFIESNRAKISGSAAISRQKITFVELLAVYQHFMKLLKVHGK
jgi:hypothetical protein